MALKTRSEVDARYTWNFSDIFADDAAWEAAYAEAEAAIGLAILVALFRNRRTINVADIDLLKG